jgi:hypothetical protein
MKKEILLRKIRGKYGRDSLTIDGLYKARRKGASKRLARMLEGVTGIPRLKFLYPEEYGDPWSEIDRMP